MRPRSRTAVLGAVVALLVTVTGCGGDDGDAQSATTGAPADPTTTTSAIGDDLPPPGALDLEPLYGAALADLGLRLTDRGGLIDRSDGGYVPSPEGDHLALYVLPVGDYSTEQYIDGIRTVALVFDDVFERWPDLASYDVCQEPTDPDGDQGPEPLPVTQIEVNRAESDAIDWDNVTVEDLVLGSQADPPLLTLRVSSDMAFYPEYADLLKDADPNLSAGGY